MAIKRDAKGRLITTSKYTVVWGESVYYPHQDKHTWKKGFSNKVKALQFLRKKNKSKAVDFTDVIIKKKKGK